MPIVEIASWAASEALLVDPAVLQPFLDHVKQADGCLGVYTGIVEEDRTTFYILILWETYQHHKALVDSAEYPSLLEKLKPSLGPGPSSLHLNHVEFNKDLGPALAGPTTEICIVTLKDGHTEADLEAAMTELAGKIEMEKGSHPPVAWGKTREDADKFYVLVGWESSKVHYNVVGQKTFEGSLQTLLKIADLHMTHANLLKYE